MDKSKRLVGILGIVVFILIIFSFLLSFLDEKEKRVVEDVVLKYLEEKYNEEFEVVDFSLERSSYEVQSEDDYSVKEINSSRVYNFIVSSSRLVEFEVKYVIYDDMNEYDKYKNNNIMEPGIYENYIYEYKIREIRKEFKEGILNNISESLSVDISINGLVTNADEMLVNYTLDNDEVRLLKEKYNKLNKRVSNIDYFNTCLEVNDAISLDFDIEVNRYIDENNLDSFKEEVVNLVQYIEELGYSNYSINFNFKDYQTANVVAYENNQLYLMFDYGNYATEEEDKLRAYILDK